MDTKNTRTRTLLYAQELVTPQATIPHGCVAVEGGRIIFAGNARTLPSRFSSDAAVLRLPHLSLAPGYIDVHVQGAGGCDILDACPESLTTIRRLLLKRGVTSFVATTVFFAGKHAQPHLDVVKNAMGLYADSSYGAEILGIHLEGPFINPLKKGMIKTCNITAASLARAKAVAHVAGGALTMITIAPEVDSTGVLTRYFTRHNVVCSVGHTNATYEETLRGIRNGMTHVTHICNAMTPLHHRAPGAVLASLLSDKVSVQLIADGKHLHPAFVKLVLKLKAAEQICLITDSVSAAGLSDGDYVYNGLKYRAHKGLALYHDGTLIGTAMTLDAMVRRLVFDFGVSRRNAVTMATTAPAKALGIYRTKGSLEQGKHADIIGLDKTLRVRFVMKSGNVIVS